MASINSSFGCLIGSYNSFRRIDMIEGLEKMAGLTIPKDLASQEANQYLKEACLKYDIKCPPPETTARLLDKVILSLLLSGSVVVG